MPLTSFPPLSSPTAIISQNSVRVIKQSYLKSARVMDFFFMVGWFSRFLFGSLEQSFPEGVIKPYEGKSLLTIGKVCRRLICYRISSHFG